MSDKSKQPSDYGSVASHCCYAAALNRARMEVEQWDKHDQFRETEADKSLYYPDLKEPYGVAIARALLDTNAVVNRMERALLQIVMRRNEFQGPSLDYMQGYRDGQEHQARIARKALGHGD